MRWLKAWPFWVFIVVGGANFLLPEIPFYQPWMPYGYDLGGMALVIVYLSFGCVSLGLYGLVSWLAASQKNPYVLKMGVTVLGLAIGLMWCYVKLMDLTQSL